MEEKEECNRREKLNFNEQAVIWRKDNEELIKYENKKKKDKSNVMRTCASRICKLLSSKEEFRELS